jgi:hypothetical protein
MRNREEQLIADECARGVLCDWRWTSDLHIAKVFPSAGRAIMKRALRDWPLRFRAEPVSSNRSVRVSFVIGHRGLERLPHLTMTLQSVAAQRDADVECVVVEQSRKPEIKKHLPAWVRYVHTSLPQTDMPYCRAWAFNVGAQVARGEVLVLHDSDILAPQSYAAEIIERYREGYEVVNLKRFIFFLAKDHSIRVSRDWSTMLDRAPESIMQNALGGSLAVGRKAYLDIGGFDESFLGWGGEDNEFWERAQTRNVWPYGYLPFVHLWHRIQNEKYSKERCTAKLLEARSAIPVEERIAELTARQIGQPEAPYSREVTQPIPTCVE